MGEINMPAQKGIRLPKDVLEDMASASSLFNLNQRGLGRMIHRSQPLVSTMLTGAPVSLEVIANLASGFEKLASQNLADGKINDSQAERIYELARTLRLPSQPAVIPPGHPIPGSAQNFVNRPELSEVLNCLEWYNESNIGQYPFTLVVEGPIDSGKTTLLRILADEAQRKKIPVSAFDCSVAATSQNSGHGLAESESLFFHLLANQLGHDLSVDAAPDAGSTLPVSSFMTYLDRLQRGAIREKSPLLILDNVTALDYRVALAIIGIVKHYTSKYEHVSNRSCINFALGLSVSNPEAYRTIVCAEINETTRVSCGWFDFTQVRSLLKQVGDDRLLPYQKILWEQYGGQPFLTHVAATELMKDGTAPDTVYQTALRGEGRFGRHMGELIASLEKDARLFFKILEYPEKIWSPTDEGIRYLLDAHLVTKTETVDTRCRLEAASLYYKEAGLKLYRSPV